MALSESGRLRLPAWVAWGQNEYRRRRTKGLAPSHPKTAEGLVVGKQMHQGIVLGLSAAYYQFLSLLPVKKQGAPSPLFHPSSYCGSLRHFRGDKKGRRLCIW